MSIEAEVDANSALRHCVLFKGFSEAELAPIVSLLEDKHVAPGTMLVREGDAAAEIFVIRSGSVEVVKRAPGSGRDQRLTVLRAGDTFGEMTFIDGSARSASVKALEDSRVAVLPMSRLRALTSADRTAEAHILRNLAGDLVHRLRGTSEATVRALEQELDLARTRAVMGSFLIYVIGLMVGYGFVLRLAADLTRNAADTSLVSIPVILGFAGAIYAMARQSGEPMASYGLTLHGWREAVRGALVWTLPILVVLTSAKWALVTTVSELAGQSVFSFGGAFDPTVPASTARLAFFMSLAYMVVVLFQEFAARGGLQGPLARFLTGKHSTAVAIFTANGLFVASHLHLSYAFAAIAFFPGLFWGWLYARYGTLVAPVVSHILIGWYGLYVLGFTRLVTH